MKINYEDKKKQNKNNRLRVNTNKYGQYEILRNENKCDIT